MTHSLEKPVNSLGIPPGSGEEMSRVDEAYHQILLRIIQRQLAGGTKLNATHLARDIGLSRTPVVQAIARLAADGIVVQHLNHRAEVRAGAENWLLELHELRVLIEPAAAARAAMQIPHPALAALQAMAQTAKPYGSPQWASAARRFDYALHLAIAEHSGNRPLGEAIRKCWSFKRISYEAGEDSPETLERGYREHLAILAALEAADPDTASAAMLFHLHSAARHRPDRRIV